MAVLAGSDYRELAKAARATGNYKEVAAISLPKQVWMDAFQAAEDWLTSAFLTTPTLSMKAAIEVETGALTNAQAKAIWDVYITYKLRHL